jgi:putative addiction module component (TIGR02574 family)
MRLLGGALRSIIPGMTKAAEAILADALRLSPDARAQLAAEILASLDGPSDPDAEAEWQAEISRRVADLEAGKTKLEPWETVKRRIEKSILGR